MKGYRLKIRGSNYKFMRLIWCLLAWTSQSKSWEKVWGRNYNNEEVDIYFLIQLWRNKKITKSPKTN